MVGVGGCCGSPSSSLGQSLPPWWWLERRRMTLPRPVTLPHPLNELARVAPGSLRRSGEKPALRVCVAPSHIAGRFPLTFEHSTEKSYGTLVAAWAGPV
ncbi:unnamed protein product [Echinostoma caproni]|uniref:Uncharacterized protein n=1 Tax=Echinostoma caproni TaxID=27848 RepID=A0A183AQP3_9TREM|nr:unnamed protein product [Echinostoma caproni]